MKRQTPVKGRAAAALLWALALALFACPGTFAQTGTSSIRGTVTDQQGGVIAGANVTLTSTEKNFNRTQVTTEDGGYLFNTVPPGAYRVVVEAAGFKRSVAEVTAQVDTPLALDMQMEPGSISESVTITSADTAPLNTTDATIGNAFESRRIQELPLNARNVVGLLSLQPGVTRGGDVNGGRRDQANITLDGVDVNEQQRGVDAVTDQAFASVLRVTPDSVQEFRVITTNANAEQGRSSGAQVSLVTKSGSNDYHGVLYHYHRNTVTTANDFFNNAGTSAPTAGARRQASSATAVPRPQLLRNIFGGAIGGPIKKDRAFFFFTYEGFREATSTSVVRLVPLPETLGQGLVRYATSSTTAGSPCPIASEPNRRCISLTPAQIDSAYLAANGVSPGVSTAALNLLQDAARRYPANDTTMGDTINTGGFRFNARTPTELDTYIGRLDFNLTDRQSLFVRGNYQDDLVGQAPQFPDTPAPDIWYHPKGLAVGHSWTASNNFVNRATYGLTRLAFTQGGDSTDPSLSFRFIFTPLLYTRALTRITPVHNIVDDVSWIKGNHNLQFGGNLRFIKNTRNSFANSFDSLTTNPSGYDASGAVLTTTLRTRTPPSSRTWPRPPSALCATRWPPSSGASRSTARTSSTTPTAGFCLPACPPTAPSPRRSTRSTSRTRGAGARTSR